MRESVIEKALVARIKALGGEIRKVSWIGRRGAPDRFVMLPSPHRNIWVELKATGVAVEDHQIREHRRMRALGELVVVIDRIAEIDIWFPLPKPMTWHDYEFSVTCTNRLTSNFPDATLKEVAALSKETLMRRGLRARDVREIYEAARNCL